MDSDDCDEDEDDDEDVGATEFVSDGEESDMEDMVKLKHFSKNILYFNFRWNWRKSCQRRTSERS